MGLWGNFPFTPTSARGANPSPGSGGGGWKRETNPSPFHTALSTEAWAGCVLMGKLLLLLVAGRA